MTKKQEIKRNMEKLGISRKEAEELYISDHEDIITPEMAEMERKAKKIKRYEKSSTPRKKTVRERKVCPNKLALSSVIANALNQAAIKHTPKNESEFNFTYCGESFTIKLIKHRAPKEQVPLTFLTGRLVKKITFKKIEKTY